MGKQSRTSKRARKSQASRTEPSTQPTDEVLPEAHASSADEAGEAAPSAAGAGDGAADAPGEEPVAPAAEPAAPPGPRRSLAAPLGVALATAGLAIVFFWAKGRPVGVGRRVDWDAWQPWLLAIAGCAMVAALLYARGPRSPGEEGAAESRERRRARGINDAPKTARQVWAARLLLGLPIPFFVLGILAGLEFIKDDAYISFRYAHNLVTGHGLVFNTGERLEGFTNFLWVLVLSPFEALGWDLFQVCEVLGTILGSICLVTTARMTEWINGDRKVASHVWGALWLSMSASFVLWAKSGLEQPLASLLPIAGAFVLWRARERDAGAAKTKSHLYAGLLAGAGCLTRPELHLLAILVGLPLVVEAVRRRAVTRADLAYVAGILAMTVPGHLFRFLYYGTVVPNTFYVKTGTGQDIWRAGLNTVREMFEFNRTGVLVVLAPLAFANRRRMLEKVTMAVIGVAFLAYYVGVGVDEMQWHRLYLPALPFVCVLAAVGARNVVEVAAGWAAQARRSLVWGLGGALAWAGFVYLSADNFAFTYRELNGFNGHGDLAGTFHPDLGKFLVRHERPGALVAFQDMGSTPYHAPDINFLDFFGLTDRTVAHARHDLGLHAFVGGNGGAQGKYDASMRDYFFQRAPEWAILTIYTPRGQEEALGKLFERDPTGGAFGDAFRYNGIQFGLWDDPRFRERYVPVRTWPRSAAYYLALFRRRDLWDQKPREVVLDAPPPPTGVQAAFEGGLELLGSDITPETYERHEVFMTTWWRLPGPMPKDLYFFIHVTNESMQVPADHIPGDWMYPADRWLKGEILEDRTLFQLPPMVMKPGMYKVYLGVYRRSTGERLPVLVGPPHADNRVLLGSFEAKPLLPLIHQLIPPTRVDVMRKYPERIIDSHREPGT